MKQKYKTVIFILFMMTGALFFSISARAAEQCPPPLPAGNCEAERPIINRAAIAGIQSVNRRSFGLINQRLALLKDDAQGNMGMSSGNEASRELKAWWQFYGQSADQDSRDGVHGYKSTTFGLAIGADKEIIEDGVLGMSFSWGDTSANSKGFGDADTEVDTYQLSLYGDYNFGRSYVNAMASYADNKIDTAKTTAAGKRTGSYHGGFYSLRGEFGRNFMRGKARLIPKIIGQYSYYSPKLYAEEGAGAQTIRADSVGIFEIGSAIDINWLMNNGEGSYFVPALHLGYRYDTMSEPVSKAAQFVAGGAAFEVQGFDPASHFFDFGLGMTYFSQEAWELLFKYDFEYSADYQAHAGSIRAAYKFYP